ncbi:hypothetical protein C8Q80DRAFT_249559 [Daedaleopsis nitida]|nr:hypothetical protein C8Q80DRAFT_249559 [Daedaleopsis nitida]
MASSRWSRPGSFSWVLGVWPDVLFEWLADLRKGRFPYYSFYNQVACCLGLDRYISTSTVFSGQSITQAIHIALAVGASRESKCAVI